MSCSKRILICSMRILNMREQLYFHHKGQLCSSMRLHDKIERLPPFFECAQSSTWRFYDIARARKNAPNWESANGNSPLLLINQQEQRISQMLLLEHFECAQSSSQHIQNANDNSNDFGAFSKHKNLKGQKKIKQQVKNIFHIRRHMSLLMAFELYYFQAILNR